MLGPFHDHLDRRIDAAAANNGPARYSAFACGIALAWVIIVPSRSPATTSPVRQASRSVVLVTLDSLRADHLQAYGYARTTSPQIEKFSMGATVFEQAYPASSWTRPSILSMLTGRYSSELTTNMGGGSPLRTGQPTLASILKQHGFATAAFYNTAQLTPTAANLQSAFDHYEDYGDRGERGVDAHVARGIDRAIGFLRSARSQVFLYVHILDPHHPYIPARNFFGRVAVNRFRDSYSFATGVPAYDPQHVEPCYLVKDRQTLPGMIELYDSEIRLADAELGRLLDFLGSDPRYRDALVIITSDHGEEFGEHGGLYHGARFYEESLRVPLIVHNPVNSESAGRRVNAVVSLVDLAPTVLAWLGIPYRTSDYSGRSLLPYLGPSGGPAFDTAFIERAGCGYDAVAAVRKGNWKAILRLTRFHAELYDLRADPREQRDLYATPTPQSVRAYQQLYASFMGWYRQVNRQLATRNTEGQPPPSEEELARLRALGYAH